MSEQQFEWDDTKAAKVLMERGIDFNDMIKISRDQGSIFLRIKKVKTEPSQLEKLTTACLQFHLQSEVT